MKILDTTEFNNKIDLFTTKLPELFVGYDFRTIEECFYLNEANESTVSSELHKCIMDDYVCSNWQWCGVQERSMRSHILYIEESLQTHPAKSLISKIKSTFRKNVLRCTFDSSKNRKVNDVIRVTLEKENDLVDDSCIGSNTLKRTQSADKFYELIKLWLYYITIITFEQGAYHIYIEPAYTKCLTDDIIKNGGIGYHITKIENEQSILKNGIRPKVGMTPKYAKEQKLQNSKKTNGYRFFPKRVFFVGNSKTREKTKKNLEKALLMKKLRKGEYCIFVIDFNKHDVDLWEDRAALNIEYAVYTHTFIPTSMIKDVIYDINEI